MRLIGITGSIACGKSTVSRELLRRGYPVIDGDELSRELTGPDGRAVQAVRSVFGDRFISPDGSMNRRLMSRLVFSDSGAREQLDLLMAPYLRSLTEQRIQRARESGADLCFLDMPLLFEKDYDSLCDTVWCVWLPEDVQINRLMSRDGYTREETLSRIRSMLSSDEKARLSSAVIDNSGSVEDTLEQVDSLVQRELMRAKNAPRRRRTDNAQAGQSPEPIPENESSSVIDRPDSFRRKPSERKKSRKLPVWLSAVLISLSLLLALSFTAQMLMRAYLTRCRQTHLEEQQAIDYQYPLEYRQLIRKYAAEYNLSPALIAAVIRNESSFRPSAESSVGAKGLMQLMPDTADWIARKTGYDGFSAALLYEPEINIRFGCWYLNYLSTMFRGDPLCVVCAYHAGQGEISSWLANPLYSSNGVSLEYSKLPDGPTKTYAGRVTRDYGIYLAKYFAENPSVSSDSTAGSV